MAWVGPAIAAGASILGSVLGHEGAEDANEANIQAARENRDWQAWMSSTAHVREVADLRNAGLNPILSAGGNGASTPSGNVPNIQDTMTGPMQIFANGAAAVGNMLQQRELLQAQVAQTEAATAKTVADTDVSTAQADNLRADTAVKLPAGQEANSMVGTSRIRFLQEMSNLKLAGSSTEADIEKKNIETQLLQLQTNSAKASSMQAQDLMDFMNTNAGRAMLRLYSAGTLARPIADVLDKIPGIPGLLKLFKLPLPGK